MRFLSPLLHASLCACVVLCKSCGCPLFVCVVVLVQCMVGAVFAVNVMRVLFVLDVSMLRECEGDSKASVGD